MLKNLNKIHKQYTLFSELALLDLKMINLAQIYECGIDIDVQFFRLIPDNQNPLKTGNIINLGSILLSHQFVFKLL